MDAIKLFKQRYPDKEYDFREVVVFFESLTKPKEEKEKAKAKEEQKPAGPKTVTEAIKIWEAKNPGKDPEKHVKEIKAMVVKPKEPEPPKDEETKLLEALVEEREELEEVKEEKPPGILEVLYKQDVERHRDYIQRQMLQAKLTAIENHYKRKLAGERGTGYSDEEILRLVGNIRAKYPKELDKFLREKRINIGLIVRNFDPRPSLLEEQSAEYDRKQKGKKE